MKWLLLVLALVLVVVIVIAVVGLLLPRDHVATAAVHIPASPQAVWQVITDPSQFPQWRPDVQRVELLARSEVGPSWREFSKNAALTMVVDVADAPTRLVTRIADRNLPFAGTWDYRLEADGSGATRITVAEHGSVYNPIFRFVSRFIFGHTATLDSYLRALGARFGADVTPTVAAGSLGDTHGI